MSKTISLICSTSLVTSFDEKSFQSSICRLESFLAIYSSIELIGPTSHSTESESENNAGTATGFVKEVLGKLVDGIVELEETPLFEFANSLFAVDCFPKKDLG